MKTTIAIACFLLGGLAHAQSKKPVELRTIQTPHSLPSGKIMAPDGKHEFALHANESTDVNLTLKVKSPGALYVTVKDKNQTVISTKKINCSRGSHNVSFFVEQDQDYIVSLLADANTRFSVTADRGF